MSFAKPDFVNIVMAYADRYEILEGGSGGYSYAGEWSTGEGAVWRELEGAILDFGSDRMQHDAMGMYVSSEKKIYTFHRHSIGDIIRFEGKYYKLTELRKYSGLCLSLEGYDTGKTLYAGVLGLTEVS